MNLSSARVKIEQTEEFNTSRYGTNEIKRENIVIDGGFPQERPLTVQEMFVRRINKALGFCITVATVSYTHLTLPTN